jgi:hypothetical protein
MLLKSLAQVWLGQGHGIHSSRLYAVKRET